MEWLYRMFFKEEFEARWFTYPLWLMASIGFWVGLAWVGIHFIRKYW